MSHIETNVKASAAPGRSVRSVLLSADHGDATFLRFEEFDPPLEPAPGERIVCALVPGFDKTPVDEGTTPRRFILTSGSLGKRSSTMIFKYYRVMTLPGNLLNAKLRFRYV